MKALLSAYHRTGIEDFARSLVTSGFELVSTGGTHRALTEIGKLPATLVSDLTGFPEILDGRVKTLHPIIHAGILARRDVPDHVSQISRFQIDTIDLVAVNLYPFVETVGVPDVTLEDALEKIDIGGPTMIRAAAKNFPHVVVVVDPADYQWISDRFQDNPGTESVLDLFTLDERKRLAWKAFQHVAIYDTAITRYLSEGRMMSTHELTLGYEKLYTLRYGENPHQQASLYADQLSSGGIVRAEQLHGSELSFNNILDADAAWRVVSDFLEPTSVIVKHTNPCGLAVHANQLLAYKRAFEGDSMSAYGGIVGFNRTVTTETARAMRGVLYHVVIAPNYEPEALEILKKRKQLKVLKSTMAKGLLVDLDVRKVSGGILLQTTDDEEVNPTLWKVVTERQPTDLEWRDLEFAWRIAKHIKSNAIVLARDKTLLGMGAGQPNRITSVHLALRIAGEKSQDSVLSSDAFMPFEDNIELAAHGGVTAVVQPGGSIRDSAVIEAANRLNIAMLFTDMRHFRH